MHRIDHQRQDAHDRGHRGPERRPARPEPAPAVPKGFRADRRRFLASSLSSLGAYAVAAGGASWLVGPGKAWAVAFDALEPELAQTLLSMTRALYPHEFLGDVYYAKVVKDLDVEASGFEDKERLELLRQGAQALDDAAGGGFVEASDDDKEAALQVIAGTPFFEAVRSKAVVSLYNQPEVWARFGYEGPSYQIGGYLEHGFDDLAWLPDPPAEASPPAYDV